MSGLPKQPKICRPSFVTTPFRPSRIYIDKAVENLPATKAILKHFPQTPSETVTNPKDLKKPKEMTWAKKGLLLTRYKSERVLKPFGANGQSLGRPCYSLDLLSNCHLECTYCILQSYLSNNPLLTVYTNIEEVLEKLSRQLPFLEPNAVIGTGRIADSLALDAVTGFGKMLIPFFAEKGRGPLLECKTKSDCVDHLIHLDHRGKTVLSWSMNPQNIVEREEFKTASLAGRLNAAKKCAEAGYKIGFHCDPLIHHEGWRKNYAGLVDQIFDAVPPEKIAWMSLGALRFPARQTPIMQKRFPKSKQIHEGLRQTHLPFLAYPEKTRKEMYEALGQTIRKNAPKLNLYLCMEENLDGNADPS